MWPIWADAEEQHIRTIAAIVARLNFANIEAITSRTMIQDATSLAIQSPTSRVPRVPPMSLVVLRCLTATCNGGKSASVLQGKVASASPPTLTAYNVATAMASHKRLARPGSVILV